MIEIKKSNNSFSIINSDKIEINIDTENDKVTIDDFDLGYPGEYEKGGILVETKEFDGVMYYNFVSEGKYISFVPKENIELKSDLQKFLNRIDILIINGSRENAKNFENIESKIAIPYGDGKHTFFSTLAQNPEEQKTLKIKSDITGDDIEFINL